MSTCTPEACNETPDCGTDYVAQLLTLAPGALLADLLATVGDGVIFRLAIPEVWPSDETLAAIKHGTGFIPLSATRGTYDYALVLLASVTTAAVSTNIDLAGYAIEPITGTQQYRFEIEPTSAVGTISMNGNIVWTSASPTSAPSTVTVDLVSDTISLSTNLSAGSADISYKSDIV